MRRLLLFVALLLAVSLATGIGFVVRTSLWRLLPVMLVVCALPGLFAVWRTRDRIAASVLIAGVTLAPIAAVAVHLSVYRVVHVDNALDEPLQIWLDGQRAMVVAPSPAIGEPPRIRIPFGHHRLGWTELSAPYARHEIDADIAFAGEHLYSPARAGCYWLEVTAYGNGSTHEIARGPQPLRELHHFERIDVWLGNTPKRVSAPFGITGKTRVAVQRYALCMDLLAAGCSPEARDEFVECQTSLHGPEGMVDCFGKAKKRCEKEGVPVDPKVP